MVLDLGDFPGYWETEESTHPLMTMVLSPLKLAPQKGN